MNLQGGGEEFRTHEFHDNVHPGFGGGSMSYLAISGIVTRVKTDAFGAITNFDITATIYNDTTLEVQGWLGGSNSHEELNFDQEKWYHGTLKDTKLTAEFAISALKGPPPIFLGPYVASEGFIDIVATNEDQLAWYCWNPEEQNPEALGGPGDYYVPTWDFGDIPQGSSATRVLGFDIPSTIPPTDSRFSTIMGSYTGGDDILINRSTSLKVSTWVDTLALDFGVPYPHLEGAEPRRSSDVSVFHNEDHLDFGDAPDDGVTNVYTTLLFNDGARHSIVPGIMLGATIDAELDGQPAIGALLDDTLGAIPDDEDGAVLAGPLSPGMVTTVDVTASVPGFLNIWMDFGTDGSWGEAGDHVITDMAVTAGVNRVGISVPGSASAGLPAYARFRFSTSPGIITFFGPAPDGEVEDYMWTFGEQENARDFGDAPDSYGTLLASAGAVHVIGGPWLGDLTNGPDPELDGQPGALALDDDNDGNDDERGVWIATGTQLVRGAPTTYNMEVNGGGGGIFQLWIDWNINGVFDHPSEMVTNVPLPVGSHALPITAPTNAHLGATFARARISSAGGLTPTGGAPDGEVEDHALTIDDGYVDWGNLQYPPATTTIVGTASEIIYGQVWLSGHTEGAGQAPGIMAELGYGPDGSAAPGNPSWSWGTAAYNPAHVSNNDEYMGQLTVGSTGVFDYAYRYSRNGLDWTYGDTNGGAYAAADAGHLVVTELDPFDITNITVVGTSDTATVQWEAENRVIYQMQYVSALTNDPLPWMDVGGEVTGPANAQNDTNAVDMKFYRVIAPYAVP